MAVLSKENTQPQPSQKFSPARLSHLIKTAILLGLAFYFAYNIVSGNLTNYINTRFAWLSYVAAVLFIVLGGVSLYALLKGDNQRHRNVSLPAVLVMAVPLVLGTLLPSQPLGASAINGAIGMRDIGGAQLGSVTKDPLERNILDWARVFASSSLPGEFDGQQADVIGFFYTEPTFPDNHFMAARFTVSCCVADATPLGLPVLWANDQDIPQGQWVRVTGTFKAGDFRDEQTPILQAESIELIEQPDHPYLYP